MKRETKVRTRLFNIEATSRMQKEKGLFQSIPNCRKHVVKNEAVGSGGTPRTDCRWNHRSFRD